MNKIRLFLVFIILIFFAGMIISCIGGIVIGSGNLVTKKLKSIYRDYTEIFLGPYCELELIPSETGEYSGTITADDNIIDTYRVIKLEGDKLIIGLDSRYTYSNVTFFAKITMPAEALYGLEVCGPAEGKINSGFNHNNSFVADVNGTGNLLIEDLEINDAIFNVSGASEVNINGTISVLKAEFNVSGASSVTGNLNASNEIGFDISGASNITLINDSITNTATFNVSGASNSNLEDFEVSEADVDISGASTSRVYADVSITGNLSGASTLYYKGTANIDVDASGGSQLTPID